MFNEAYKKQQRRNVQISDLTLLLTEHLFLNGSCGWKYNFEYISRFEISHKVDGVKFGQEVFQPLFNRKFHNVFHDSLSKPLVKD